MTDLPGGVETITQEAVQSPSTQTETPALRTGETDYKTTFSKELTTTIDSYYENVLRVLPPPLDSNPNSINADYDAYCEDPSNPAILKAAGIGFQRWFTTDYQNLLAHLLPKNATLPEGQQYIADLQADLRHDLSGDILNGLSASLTDDEDMHPLISYFANPYTVHWPEHVLRRLAKQTTDTADHKPISGTDAYTYMLGLFKTMTAEESEKYHYDIDTTTHFELEGDFDLLLGVLYNPLNNIRQIAHEKGLPQVKSLMQVTEDPNKPGHILLKIQDDMGGMPEEFLEHSDTDPTIQKALERGTTKRKNGTGTGLAIVNKVVQDNLHGTVQLSNVPFPGSEKKGLLMEISVPGKILSKAG